MSTRVSDPASTPTPTSTPVLWPTRPPSSPTRPGAAAPARLSGTRFALVVLVSAVVSVAASTSVLALTSPDQGQQAPAAVIEQDPGSDPGQPGAVEEDAGRVLEDYVGSRADFCPHGSYPPVAC